VEINMDSNKLNTLTQYLAMGWALVPLHHVPVVLDTGAPICSCRAGAACKSAGKHPRLSAWQLEANLVRTVEQLQAWPAETNWGLATGRASGVWALDVDPKNGGDDALAALIAEGVVNQTRVHWTGSRGRHLLYAMPADFVPTNRTGALPPGIDVRGDGGQIVLPPSVSGIGPYDIDADFGLGTPVPASAALLDLIRPLPVAPHVPRDIMARVDPGGRYASYARSAVDGELRSLRETHSSRNSRAWAAAVRIIELAHAPWSELDIDDEYDRWREAGHAHPDGIDVPPTELDAVWRSALRHVGAGQAAPPPDKPWPPRGDVDLLDFLKAPVGSGIATGASVAAASPDPFAPIPSGARGGPEPAAHSPSSGLTLPEEFWAARPVLAHVRQVAHARVVSGDVLFYSVLARLASLWPYTVQLHSGIGSGASANLYVAVVGPSGAGKTSGVGVAREVLPVPHWLSGDDYAEDWPLGTGEGIAESYMGRKLMPVDDKSTDVRTGLPKMRQVRTQVRHNALLHADEGEVLTRMWERAGATIGETLRRGYMGSTIGQANGREETTRIVKAGRYSLGLIIGFQPETAQPLLADAAAGTPQRFLWGWAMDASVPDVPPASPGPLTGVWRAAPADPGGTGWLIGDPFSSVDQTPVSFDQAIRDELGADRRARLRGEEGATPPELDAHMPLMLVKVAALLAQLDGRRHVTVEDWRLAKLVWTTSCAVRDHCIELGRQKLGKERAGEIRRHADKEGAAEVARLDVHQGRYDARVARVARRIAQLIAERKDVARAELRRAVAQRDRDAFDEALDMAVANGWVARDEAHLTPGPVGL
jgi:hypothetical protein